MKNIKDKLDGIKKEQQKKAIGVNKEQKAEEQVNKEEIKSKYKKVADRLIKTADEVDVDTSVQMSNSINSFIYNLLIFPFNIIDRLIIILKSKNNIKKRFYDNLLLVGIYLIVLSLIVSITYGKYEIVTSSIVSIVVVYYLGRKIL